MNSADKPGVDFGILDAGKVRSRPRMVFFRWIRPDLPDFLRAHLREQLRSMEQFFDVFEVDWECDYGQVCDILQPDICVFESGVYAGERLIRNTSSHPEIPKLGFLHADAFDSSRAAFVADMARWGVNWFFTTSMSMAEYTPEIADRLFVWPNAVDPEVFRDYGLSKNIPILLTGSQARHYPWRNAISRTVTSHFPTMIMPHFGWNGEAGTARMFHGADYARLINASLFVPACGTICKDIVRKHLEIPASMACLVTERSQAVESFGFADMINCVFADESDIGSKLDHLLTNREELDRITRAGYDLVHERHSLRQRNQVLQWFNLVKQHGTEIQIQQQWPHGTLTVSPTASALSGERKGGYGRDRELLASGWAALGRGDLAAGHQDFLKCLNYFFIPEGAVGATFASLLQGDLHSARQWTSRLLAAALSHHGAPEPDPVQWACEIRVLLCSGDLGAAVVAADQFPSLWNQELSRVRGAVHALAGRTDPEPTDGHARATICPIPIMTDQRWRAQLSTMLRACGQVDLAIFLGEITNAAGALRQPHAGGTAGRGSRAARSHRRIEARLRLLRRGNQRPAPERWLRARLAPLKRWIVSDEWSDYLIGFLESEPVSDAILLGPGKWSRSVRSVRAGLMRNPSLPAVTAIDVVDRFRGWPRAGLQDSERADLSRHLESKLQELSGARALLVFVTSRGCSFLGDATVLNGAATVLLEGTNHPMGCRVLEELVDRHGYVIVNHEVESGPGRAILRKRPGSVRHTELDAVG